MTLPIGASAAPRCEDSSTSPDPSHPAGKSTPSTPLVAKRGKQIASKEKPKERPPALSMLGPEPRWLAEVAPEAADRRWIRGLGVAIGLDSKGTSLGPAFGSLALAFGAHGKALDWDVLKRAAGIVAKVAKRAAATTLYHELALLPDGQTDPIAHAICRAAPRSQRLAHESLAAQIGQSISVLDALRSKTTVSQKAVQRCATMASACRSDSGLQARDQWQALAKLSAFDPSDLKRFLGEQPKSEPYELARQLLDAQDSKKEVPFPASAKARAAGAPSTDKASSEPAQQREGAPSAPTPSTAKEERNRAPIPSVRGLKAAAVYAGMAEQFGVRLVLNRLPPARLSLVTRGCHQALRGADQALADQALLLTMSVVISHDFDSTLNLAFGPAEGVDLWYSVEERCVRFDRHALRGKVSGSDAPNWGTLYVPPEAADRIESLAAARGSLKSFRELFSPTQLETLCSATEAWAKSFTDKAHGAWSARVAHSLGLVFLEAGASDLEAAIFTLNLSLSAPAAPSYYAPSTERQYELVLKVFQELGYETPEPVPAVEDPSDPDVPTDDDIRREWANTKDAVRTALRDLPQADVAGVLTATNRAMAGLRRGFEMLTGARDQRRENPRFRDVLTSLEWFYLHDKKTRPRSDRLLPMTADLADLVRTARLVRDLACKRLLELGVQASNLAPQLAKPDGNSMVFAHLQSVVRKNGLHVSVRRIDDGDMKLLPQVWKGQANMGRRFWVHESSRSQEWMAERVVTGHGRGLNHVGSGCLAIPVHDLLRGVQRLFANALERLALPRLSVDLDIDPTPIPLTVDLRRFERRAQAGSTSSDTPTHHCDDRTLAALEIVSVVRPYVGRASTLSAAGRALLGLVVADGLHHTGDLEPAWNCLRTLAKSKGTVWLKWTRPSGQPMAMPLQPPTRLAADEVTAWPTFAEAEAELSQWLRGLELPARIQAVAWPATPAAALTALCAQMSRWVRLHVPPMLVEAYQPECLAATLTWESLDQLLAQTLTAAGHFDKRFAERRAQVKQWTGRRSDLARIRRELGLVVNSTAAIGEHKARVKAVLAKLQTSELPDDIKLHQAQARVIEDALLPSFVPSALSGAASMILHWIRLECELTYRRGKEPLDPGTIYEYLTRVLPWLLKCWPQDLDATTISSRRWRKITKKMLRRTDRESDTHFNNRRIAWQRIVKTLSASPLYGAAASALEDAKAGDVVRTYVPSAASTLVSLRHVALLNAEVDAVFFDEALACPQARGMLSLMTDPGLRKSEAGVPRTSNLAKDGTFLFKAGNGFDRRKTPRSAGPTPLSARAGAQLLELKATLLSLTPPHSHFFAEQDGDVDLAYAAILYDVLVCLTQSVLGTQAVHGHSHRGAAAMRRFAPHWEAVVRRMGRGPFELVDAIALMSAMRGAGPAHLATVLTGIGHASHRTFARRYCTAWPLFYAACMRATLATVELDASVIRAMPHLNADEDAITKAMNRRRASARDRPSGEPRDDWTWSVRHHYEAWKREPRDFSIDEAELNQSAAQLNARLADARPLPAEKELYYLVLRWLGSKPIPVMVKLGMGLRCSGRLETLVPLLPTLGQLEHSRKPKALKPKFAEFIRNQLSTDVGQALLAALSRVEVASQAVIAGQLADHAGAPEVTPAGLLTVLGVLPPQLAIELAMLSTHWVAALESALKGNQRARVPLPLKKRKSRRPRVRVIPHQSGRIPQNHARALTLVTQVCAAAMQLLAKQEEKS
jgi:hypothetical protein